MKDARQAHTNGIRHSTFPVPILIPAIIPGTCLDDAAKDSTPPARTARHSRVNISILLSVWALTLMHLQEDPRTGRFAQPLFTSSRLSKMCVIPPALDERFVCQCMEGTAGHHFHAANDSTPPANSARHSRVNISILLSVQALALSHLPEDPRTRKFAQPPYTSSRLSKICVIPLLWTKESYASVWKGLRAYGFDVVFSKSFQASI